MIAQGVFWSIIAWVKLCTPLITPEIDIQYALPALIMVPRPATRRRPGIVHQYSDFAEGVVSTVFETLNLVQFANVRRHGQHVGGASLCDGSDFCSGLFEGIALEI